MSKEIKILTVPDLTKHILGLWESKRKESEQLQQEAADELKAAIQKESDLQIPLKEARSIVKKMQKEYFDLERKSEKKARDRITKNAIREADVRAGKVTLKEFQEKGIYDKDIESKVIKAITGELEDSLKVCREKSVEILRLEKGLLETQHLIRNLLIRPAKILQGVFKDCVEISDREIGEFLAELNTAKTSLDLINHKILLTQGKSLGSGHRWDHLSYKQALSVQFDPILDVSCVAELKTRLKGFEDSENISISFYLKSKSVDVTAAGQISHRKSMSIKMSDLKDKK